jgi:hypothetical protein
MAQADAVEAGAGGVLDATFGGDAQVLGLADGASRGLLARRGHILDTEQPGIRTVNWCRKFTGRA